VADDPASVRSNPLAAMPSWVWLIVAMGGGSGIGLTGFSIGNNDQEDPGECPRRKELAIAIDRAEAAEASNRAMIGSVQEMAVLLGQCSQLPFTVE
jgi:hypothetical protein